MSSALTYANAHPPATRNPALKSTHFTGIFSSPCHDWFPLRVYSLLPVTIGSRSGYNSTSFYGSSCADNGKGAHNTPEPPACARTHNIQMKCVVP
eukprot:837392-Pyramimonas_sp.AAC.2